MISLEATKITFWVALATIKREGIKDLDGIQEVISDKLSSSEIDYNMYTISHFNIEDGTSVCNLMIQTRADGTRYRESCIKFGVSAEDEYEFLGLNIGEELKEIEESEDEDQ